MWWRSIRPRLHQHLPTDTILEIAPGCGRWTAYLINECRQLIGIDLTERCVTRCRDRFAGSSAEFHVNDGQSLPMVPDASVDLTFTFDSLVHAEAEQIRQYLVELARALRPGGVAFVHHSNLGAYAQTGGAIPWYIRERYWRAASVSARTLRDAASHAGLRCVAQELVNWVGHDSDVERHLLPGEYVPLTDCFSTIERAAQPSSGCTMTRVYVNRHFVNEWRELANLSRLYGRESRLELVGSLRQGSANHVAPAWRGVRPRTAGWLFSLRDPLARSVAARRCPDCAGPLSTANDAYECGVCRVAYLLR